jgi:hypothetical protein
MKANRNWMLLVQLLLGVALPACQPEDFPIGSATCPIINGTPDTSQEHMAVVYLQMVHGQYASGCSGTLIGPRIVLTAAHCVYGNTAEDVTVFFGDTNINAQSRSVSDVTWHTGYDSQDTINDIGLVRLAEDPPPGVEPIPFLPHSIGITTDDIGDYLEYVGFGQTSPSNPYSSGTKMTMTNQLKWICYSGGGCSQFNPAHMNTFCQDQTPSGVCFGDSGGPAFIRRSGTEFTAGIASYVGGDCEYFGCHTKVDEYEDFIRDFAGEPNGIPCVEDSDCISSACVENVCCENSCAGRCHSCNQPGSEGLCLQLPDGTPCPDSDVCNGEETCSAGSCQRGQPLVCHDSIDCTVDTCDPVKGCDFQPLAADCDDREPCTRDLCDPELGCVHEPLEDGLECAKDMTCVSGVCKKKPSAGGCTTGAGAAGSNTLPLALFLAFLLLRAARSS